MIKSERGEVTMTGTKATIKAEMGTTVRVFVDEFGKEEFDKLVELAMVNDDVLERMAMDRIRKDLDELLNKIANKSDKGE